MDAWFALLSVAAVLAKGFFVATEMALVKLRKTRLEALIEEGRPGAENLLEMVRHLDAYLSATQFGVTLTSLGLGALGEPAFANLIEKGLLHFISNGDLAATVAHTIS